MIEKVFVIFIGLVLLFVVILYPSKVVELLQLFVDGARGLARALSNLDLPNPK